MRKIAVICDVLMADIKVILLSFDIENKSLKLSQKNANNHFR